MSIYSILLYADKEGGDARGVGSASTMRYTVGNGKNGKTHGRRWGLMRSFLPLVMAKTQLPTVENRTLDRRMYRG